MQMVQLCIKSYASMVYADKQAQIIFISKEHHIRLLFYNFKLESAVSYLSCGFLKTLTGPLLPHHCHAVEIPHLTLQVKITPLVLNSSQAYFLT